MSLIIEAVIAIAKPTPSTTGVDFSFLLPLLYVLIGGLVSAATSFLLNSRSNKQQLERDKAAYEQQRERDEQAYERQQEREQAGYERSLKDAKRERLRSAYKVILNAAQEYEAAIHQFSYVAQGETIETRNERLNASLKKELAGVNQAMIEITLEDIGTDVRTIFAELQRAFNNYATMQDSNAQFRGSFSQVQLDNDKNIEVAKLKELTTAMQKHLKELEL
jgi:hypothetical protein